MLRSDEQQRVCLIGRSAQGGRCLGDLALDVDVLVVERDVAEVPVDHHVNLLRRVQLDGFRQLLVGGLGAEAAYKGKDGALGHGNSWGLGPRKGRGPV